MNPRLETLLKAFVLIASGLMFYAKISDGTLAFYINQRFAWLSMLAVLIFIALAASLAYRALQAQAQAREPATALNEGDELSLVRAQVAQAAHQQHSQKHSLSWVGLGLLALPIALGFFTPARPLGAGAIESRGIGLVAPDRPGSVTQAQRVAAGPKNILDWLRDFSRTANPDEFRGKEADVIGFVYKDPRSKENEFWVSRFAVSCCVADASALGLLVQTDQAASLKTDSWVRVTGKFDTGEFAGERLPMIVAEAIEPAEQPNQPYLYP
jgi:uncharacterized repeat protein (TIGR03943 family)